MRYHQHPFILSSFHPFILSSLSLLKSSPYPTSSRPLPKIHLQPPAGGSGLLLGVRCQGPPGLKETKKNPPGNGRSLHKLQVYIFLFNGQHASADGSTWRTFGASFCLHQRAWSSPCLLSIFWSVPSWAAWRRVAAACERMSSISCVDIGRGLCSMDVAQNNDLTYLNSIDQRMSVAYEGYDQQASILVPHRVGPTIRNVIIWVSLKVCEATSSSLTSHLLAY